MDLSTPAFHMLMTTGDQVDGQLCHIDTGPPDLPDDVMGSEDIGGALDAPLATNLPAGLAALRRQVQHARRCRDPRRLARLLAALDDTLRASAAELDLVRATSELNPLPTDRLEPWPLLEAAWGTVAPQAALRGVQARFRPHADPRMLGTVYGSARWLGRLLVECLESAMLHAAPGSTLEIEHRPDGSRAQIVLRDCQAFASGLDAASWRLAQAIVQAHGGALRTDHEDGRRDLLIELPTGAPLQTDATLSLAQAERFVGDLAALRQRARRQTLPDTTTPDLPAGDPP